MNPIRAQTLTLLQSESEIPEHCYKGYTFNEDGGEAGQFDFPILTESCLTSILKQPPDHVLTIDDFSKLSEWWAKNNEDAKGGNDGSAYQFLWGAFKDGLNNHPISDAPDGEHYVVDRQKSLGEDASNAIRNGLSFFTDPATWLALGGVIVGGFMVIYAVPRISQRSI